MILREVSKGEVNVWAEIRPPYVLLHALLEREWVVTDELTRKVDGYAAHAFNPSMH